MAETQTTQNWETYKLRGADNNNEPAAGPKRRREITAVEMVRTVCPIVTRLTEIRLRDAIQSYGLRTLNRIQIIIRARVH